MISILKILPTNTTPEVVLNPEGSCKISGRSIPIYPLQLFKPIMNWIREYTVEPVDVTNVDFSLEVINGDSIKFLMSFLIELSNVKHKNKQFIINWYYKDEDVLEIGENIASALGFNFNCIKLLIENDGAVTDIKSKNTKIDQNSITETKTSLNKESMKEKPLLGQTEINLKKKNSRRNFKILGLITLFVLLIVSTFLIVHQCNNRYKKFYGNWEIKAPQEGLDGYLINNISIYSSKNLILVYAKGNFRGRLWGPLLFVAKHIRGILEVEPSKFYGFGGSVELNNLFSQPFKIYYSYEYDRLILGNAFFVRSKVKVWND